MTQKTKDWATRTPLKVYLPWHRKLKIESHEPHYKSTNHDTENEIKIIEKKGKNTLTFYMQSK
jgi:hypothetical protein